MELKFIDHNAANDRRSRKAIRSHVMKGRNLGKKVRRGRKHAPDKGFFSDVAKVPEKDPGIMVSSEDTQLFFPEIAEMEKAITPSNYFSGSEFAYFAFPVQFTTSMRYLFTRLFAIAYTPLPFVVHIKREISHGSDSWYRIKPVHHLSPLLHCLLAMTATFLSLFEKPEVETLEATRHFSQTLRLVNRDLSTDKVPQEPTFAVVTTLTIHGTLCGDLDRALIHFRGLQRMLGLLPGGLMKMREYNLALMHKICRTDVDIAVTQGTPTRFGSQVAAIQHAVVSTSLGGGSARGLPTSLDELCAPLKYITRDVLALCRRPGRSKMDAFQFQEIMISICYRLLDFAPLRGPRPENTLDDVWQLGLLGFMTTIVYATDCIRSIHCPLLRTLLDDRVDRVSENQRLYLWLLFVCALSATSEDQKPITKIKDLVDELRLRTWEDPDPIDIYSDKPNLRNRIKNHDIETSQVDSVLGEFIAWTNSPVAFAHLHMYLSWFVAKRITTLFLRSLERAGQVVYVASRSDRGNVILETEVAGMVDVKVAAKFDDTSELFILTYLEFYQLAK
ncbi:Fc.00g031700.m01.CDS01 [Cosmosporella sp. VM-42]